MKRDKIKEDMDRRLAAENAEKRRKRLAKIYAEFPEILGLVGTAKRVADWFMDQSAKHEAAAAIDSGRFPQLADARRFDASNYRAMAKDLQGPIDKLEGRPAQAERAKGEAR